MTFGIRSLNRRTFLKHLSFSSLGSQTWLRSALHTAGIVSSSVFAAGELEDATRFFQSAQPLWPTGRDHEMNRTVAFQVTVDRPTHTPVILSMAASTLYRLTINGAFRSWGPARGPHAFYRVDVLDITDQLKPGPNVILIEVACYNINSFWTLNQPSFLQAEITSRGSVLASTQGQGLQFSASITDTRLQRVQRYSFQRAFAESYRFGQPSNRPLECSIMPAKQLLARGAPYPDFSVRLLPASVSSGRVMLAEGTRSIRRPRFVANIGPKLLGYTETELETRPYLEFQRFRNQSSLPTPAAHNASDSMALGKDAFRILDFGADLTGFLGMRVRTTAPTHLYITFDEKLTAGDVYFTRLDCANIVEFYLDPGEHALETFEPYTMRFIKITVMEGNCAISGVFLREYTSSAGLAAKFHSSDPALNELFAAARESYRQNSVDLFTDCPSRERAGWLCDSFFTSRASIRLTGNTQVERTFLQNFLLPARFDFIPDGMLPMCYPSDHNDGAYIVNWAMWFVLQVEEYLTRSGDRAMVDALKPRITALLRYLANFRNEDGLLENLGRNVYIDASEANKYVQGVNYPTNMLYAEMIECANRLYGPVPGATDTARLRATIQSQSFDGSFYSDNAVREGGRLVRTHNRSEACQYYAFYFGVAQRDRQGDLWQILRDEFKVRGPLAGYPQIARCDILIGGILRFELLSRAGLTQQLFQECKERLLSMAQATGTLWEHDNDQSSLNHAFQSHTAHLLYRDGLGIRDINAPTKRAELHFTSGGLDHCEGSIPTIDGPVSLQWRKKQQTIHYRCSVPPGYSLHITSSEGLTLVRAGA